MNDAYLAAAYWGPRKSPRNAGAQRIARLLSELKEIDARFARLYEVGDSLARPVGEPIGYAIDEIERLTEPDEQFPDLGYTFSATLPPEDRSAFGSMMVVGPNTFRTLCSSNCIPCSMPASSKLSLPST